MLENEEQQGAVFYTDGGCGPTNPGFMGYGIHGYIYKFDKPKKGAGLVSHVLTSAGYVSKSNLNTDNNEQVTPISYIDAIGSNSEYGTNNIAELSAASNALEKAAQYNLSKLTLVCDSEYVLNGITDWSKSWIANNWVKRDGSPVPHADRWLSLLGHIEILKNRGVELTYIWVRGHGDGQDNSHGNLIADRLATIGKAYSSAGQTRFWSKETAADGYWKSDVDKHPLLSHRSFYFSTNKDTHVTGEYLLGNQDNRNELLGKKVSDGAYAVIQTADADPVLEFIREYMSENTGDYERLVKAHVDNIFTPDVYDDLIDHRQYFLTKYRPNAYDIRTTFCKTPIADVLEPPLIAQRAFDCLGSLKTILMAYRANTLKDFYITDITPILYDTKTIEKKKKGTVEITTEISLKPEYNVGYAALKTRASVKTKQGDLLLPVTLTLGIDLPDRNTLKRIDSGDPKVFIITWSDAPNIFKYATIVHYKEDVSIWCGFYSNLVIIHDAMMEDAKQYSNL